MSKLIPPTPGRVVWYYPSQHEIDAKQIAIYDQAQPLAATVAYVFSDRMVNLSVVDQAGAQFRRTSVQLLQEDDPVPHTSEGPYAAWMPYQLGQAKQAADVGKVGEAAQQAESAGKFVDVAQYQGKAPEGAAIGTLSGGSLAAAQGFVAGAVAEQAAQLHASTAGASQTVETKVYPDGTSATGTAPLPGESPVAQVMADAKQLADAVAGLPPEGSAIDSGKAPEEQAPA